MSNKVSFEVIATLARQLSPAERVRLIAQVAATLQEEDFASDAQIASRHSSYGLLKGLDLSAQDIDDARHDLFGEFPHEDVG